MSAKRGDFEDDVGGRLIKGDPRELWYLALPNKLTPAQCLQIMRAALGGDIWQAWQLCSLMLDTWPVFRMASHQLREAVAYAKYNVVPFAEDGQEPTETAKAKAGLVSRAVKGFSPDPFSDEHGFSGMVYGLADAMLLGLSVEEVLWHKVRGEAGVEVLPRAAAWVHPRHYTFSQDGRLAVTDSQPERDFGMLSFWAKTSLKGGMDPDAFIAGQFISRSGSSLGAGLMRPLTWPWAARQWGNEWMLQAAKKYGAPFLTLSYIPGKSDQEDRNRMEQFARQASSDRYLIHPQGSVPTVHPAGSLGPDNPQRHIAEEADRMCLYLLLGQQGTTLPTAGALGNQETHQSVKQERVQALADWLARNPLRQFARAVLRKNYGEDSECPTIAADFTKPLSAPEVGGLASAISGAGVPVLASEFYQKIGFTEPEPGDTIYQRGAVTEMLTEEEKFAQQLQQQQAQAELQIGLQAEAAGQVAQQPNEAKASQKDVAPLPLPVVKAKLGKMGRGQLLKLDALVAKAERAEQLNGEWAEVEQILKGRT